MKRHTTTEHPVGTLPAQRYASLHRAVEKGIANDETWAQLARVCVELGLPDEAAGAFRNVRGASERFHVQNLLLRHGIIERADPSLQRCAATDSRGGLRADLTEAAEFLTSESMALTLVVTTATFPLVVGLGGYLTSGGPSAILPLIAIFPAALVLMAIGALARRVLVDASRGFEDAPDLPSPRHLGREALNFAVEAVPTACLLLGPAAVLYTFGVPAPYWVTALALGALLLPMGWVLRSLRGDWEALGPVLWRAVYRGGLDYVARSACVVALFAPAVGLLYAAGNAAIYLQLALVGPLLVTPMLMSARMLGRFLAKRRNAFRALLQPSASSLAGAPERGEEPPPRRSGAANPSRAPRRRPAARAMPAGDAAARSWCMQAPRAQLAAPGGPVVPHPTPHPAPLRSGLRSQTADGWDGDACLDLARLPGAKVLTGADRLLGGAAAQR